MNILIVGGGNMGRAYAKALLTNKLTDTEHLFFLEKVDEQADLIRQTIAPSAVIKKQAGEFIGDAEVLLFAVKPQDAKEMFSDIQAFIHPSQLGISIMAGIQLSTIQQHTKLTKIVRAMPNLPLLSGEGMTVYTSTPNVTDLEKSMIDQFLGCTGKSFFTNNEHMIDATTAVSGSGPAYVFYFMQAMISTAQQMGFTEQEAELLVVQTFRGALNIYQSHDLSCTEWINKVSSKGGTTEVATKCFHEGKLPFIIQAGMQKALERSVELSSLNT